MVFYWPTEHEWQGTPSLIHRLRRKVCLKYFQIKTHVEHKREQLTKTRIMLL